MKSNYKRNLLYALAFITINNMNMNILRYCLYITLLVSVLAACKTKDQQKRTPNGFDFVHLIDEDGRSPDFGDEVNFRLYVRTSTDSIVHQSFDTPNNPLPFSTVTLPDPTLEVSKARPHIDVLSMMSPGDSVRIFFAIDSLERKPIGFQNEDFILYDVVMLDFKKKEVKVKQKAKPLPIDEYEVTPGGYPFVFHKDEEGESPKVGEYIHFRMYIRNDEGIVYSTTKNSVDKNSYKTAPYVPTSNASPQMDAFGIMSPGDSVTLYYQIDTLDQKPKGFENSDMVYYDIVLVDVLTRAEHGKNRAEVSRAEQAKQQEIKDREKGIVELLKKTNAQYKNGELTTKVRSMKTGLRYMIIEPGNGEKIQTGSRVIHHFYCMMEDNQPFGGSYTTGEPYDVVVGTQKVISGWESGLRMLEEGSKAILFVPSEQAYGAQGMEGKVPPNTDLLFYIDVVQVR